MEKKYVNNFDTNCLKGGLDLLKNNFSEFNQEILLGAVSRINTVDSVMIGEFLSHLDNNRDKWNTDLTRYDWRGNIVEFNLEDVLKEIFLKRDNIIICGHVNKVYVEEDAYCTQILDDGRIVDLCSGCFNTLESIDNRLFAMSIDEYINLKSRISFDLKTNYFWDGSFVQLQIALEKIKG